MFVKNTSIFKKWERGKIFIIKNYFEWHSGNFSPSAIFKSNRAVLTYILKCFRGTQIIKVKTSQVIIFQNFPQELIKVNRKYLQ